MDKKVLEELRGIKQLISTMQVTMVTKEYLDNALHEAVTEVTLNVDQHKADKKAVEKIELRVERLEEKVLL